MQGYELDLVLQANHKEDGKVQLGVFASLESKIGQSVAFERKICSQKVGSGGAYSCCVPAVANRYRFKGDLWGADFFSKDPISSIDHLADFIVDGHIRLRCTVIKLDGRQPG